MLTGIAIDKGYIASVDDEVWRYLKTPVIKKNKDPRKQHITIQDLLTMRSGMDCNDWDKRSKGQEDKVYKKKDWLQYTADLPMTHKPGEKASYCTMGVTLLAEAISQASGLSIDAFAEKYLFKPLGITDVSWGHTSKRKNIIASGKRLYMRPRDMAKIGLLVLNKGSWLKQSGQAEQVISEQIISEQWIDQSTATHTRLGGREYGYLWWQFTLKSKDKSTRVISANGNGGQYIFVFPELDMVAVFTGGAYNSKSGQFPYAILRDIYFPTFAGG